MKTNSLEQLLEISTVAGSQRKAQVSNGEKHRWVKQTQFQRGINKQYRERYFLTYEIICNATVGASVAQYCAS